MLMEAAFLEEWKHITLRVRSSICAISRSSLSTKGRHTEADMNLLNCEFPL